MENNGSIILAIIALVIIASCVLPVILSNAAKQKKIKKENEERLAAERNEKMQLENALNTKGFKYEKSLSFQNTYFALNNTDKKIFLQTPNVDTKILNYDDIISYELLEDGQMLTKGSAGNAAVGAVLFGATGAIVGAATGKKQTNVCTMMQLRITIKDVLNPSIILDLIKYPGAIKGGYTYTKAFNFAKEITSTLNVIQNAVA